MGLPQVFVITNEEACRHGGVVLTVARMLKDLDVDGRVAVVARHKRPGSSIAAASLCEALLPICRRAGARLLAHTDPTLVGPLGLDGVHLPSTSKPRLARLQMPRGRWLGISRHQGDALDDDDDDSDYATLSPIFAPTSKPLDRRDTLGLPSLQGHRRRVLALGGIDALNAAACLQHGAAGVAVVGAVLGAIDPRRALLALLQATRLAEAPT